MHSVADLGGGGGGGGGFRGLQSPQKSQARRSQSHASVCTPREVTAHAPDARTCHPLRLRSFEGVGSNFTR